MRVYCPMIPCITNCNTNYWYVRASYIPSLLNTTKSTNITGASSQPTSICWVKLTSTTHPTLTQQVRSGTAHKLQVLKKFLMKVLKSLECALQTTTMDQQLQELNPHWI